MFFLFPFRCSLISHMPDMAPSPGLKPEKMAIGSIPMPAWLIWIGAGKRGRSVHDQYEIPKNAFNAVNHIICYAFLLVLRKLCRRRKV